MTGLMLVGASGLAREVMSVVWHDDRYDAIRVIDDDPRTWGTRVGGADVVGGLDLVVEYPDHRLVVCTGHGRVRRGLVQRLAALGVARDRYATVLHPSIEVPASCGLGAGSILLSGTVLTADVHIGEHVLVMPGVVLTHDDVVEDFATLCAGVALGGNVRVGAAAYVGMNACVREGVTLGEGATLGMGAALVRDLPAGATWAGVPAHPVRDRRGVGS